MTKAVFDTSAILAWLWSEPGADRLGEIGDGAYLSTVNLAEVVQKLVADAAADAAIRETLETIPGVVVPFEHADAVEAGLLRRLTKSKGLSLGDRACLALGKRLGLPVYTADRAWADLDLGVEVVLIR